jgi:hypothetical protein
VQGLFVWGFTAGIVDRVLALAGWERPWNRERLEPLPPPVLGPVSPPAPETLEERLEDTLVQQPLTRDAS